MSPNEAPLDLLGEALRTTRRSPGENRPAVTLAWAQSIDGSIAGKRGEQTALSGPESLVCTHFLRSSHDAVLVGIDTVLADDPRLTVREYDGTSPSAVVLDGSLRTSPAARLFESGVPVYLVHRFGVEPDKALPKHAVPVAVESDDAGRVNLRSVLRELGSRGFRSLMVEGGARVLSSFLREDLADLLIVTVVPVLMGGYGVIVGDTGSRFAPVRLKISRRIAVGEDEILVGTR